MKGLPKAINNACLWGFIGFLIAFRNTETLENQYITPDSFVVIAVSLASGLAIVSMLQFSTKE